MTAPGGVSGDVPCGIGLRVLVVFPQPAACVTSPECLSCHGKHFLGHINDGHTENDIFHFNLAIIHMPLATCFLPFHLNFFLWVCAILGRAII